MGRAYSTDGREERRRCAYKETEGNTALRKPRRRCDNNIKMDLGENRMIVVWIQLAQNRDQCWSLVNTVVNFRFP
jgi:hypothetical protein